MPSNELGDAIAAHQRGDVARADALYRAVLRREPTNPDALHLLGVVAYQRGENADAARHIREAIRHNPGKAEYYSNLSLPLREVGRLDDALAAADEAVRLKPEFADAYANRGSALMGLRRWELAAGSFERAIELKPGVAGFHNSLGNAYRELRDYVAAESAYREALAIRPSYAHAHFGLGITLDKQHRSSEALAALNAALEADPTLAEAHTHIGEILFQEGLIREGAEALQRAISVNPEHTRALYFKVFYQNFFEEVSAADMLEAGQAFSERMVLNAPALPRVDHRPDPERALRIGFVSGDLHMRHPVGSFTRALLGAIDRSRVSLFGYDTLNGKQSLGGMFETFRDIEGLSDRAVCDIVRRDRIDILIDLSGYTDGARPDVFAARPAPVQASWLGYSGTTGNPGVDHIIADRWVIPPGEEEF